MTVRLVTIPLEGVGPLRCRACWLCSDTDNDDDEDPEEDSERSWCKGFDLWIPDDENGDSERLDICLESEVER